MLDERETVMEGLRAALADGEDVDDQAKNRVRDLRRVGKEDLLLDGLGLLLGWCRFRLALGCYDTVSLENVSR